MIIEWRRGKIYLVTIWPHPETRNDSFVAMLGRLEGWGLKSRSGTPPGTCRNIMCDLLSPRHSFQKQICNVLSENKCLRHNLSPAHHFNAHQIAPLFHRELTKAGHFLAGIAIKLVSLIELLEHADDPVQAICTTNKFINGGPEDGQENSFILMWARHAKMAKRA